MNGPLLIIMAAALVLVLAAGQDFLFLRIANGFSIALVLLFAGWVALTGLKPSLWINIVNFLVILVIGAWLFSMGWLGGGDVKLFAAIALWFGWPEILWLVVAITLSGGVFTVLLYILRRVLVAITGKPSSLAIFRPKGPIPYGVAIALGGIACLHGFGPHPAAPVPAWTIGLDR